MSLVLTFPTKGCTQRHVCWRSTFRTYQHVFVVVTYMYMRSEDFSLLDDCIHHFLCWRHSVQIPLTKPLTDEDNDDVEVTRRDMQQTDLIRGCTVAKFVVRKVRKLDPAFIKWVLHQYDFVWLITSAFFWTCLSAFFLICVFCFGES